MPLGSYCPVAVSLTVYSKIVLYCFSSELSLHPCCFSTTLVCLLAQKGGEFLCPEEMILEDHPTLLGPFVVQRYLLGEYSQVFPSKKKQTSALPKTRAAIHFHKITDYLRFSVMALHCQV